MYQQARCGGVSLEGGGARRYREVGRTCVCARGRGWPAGPRARLHLPRLHCCSRALLAALPALRRRVRLRRRLLPASGRRRVGAGRRLRVHALLRRRRGVRRVALRQQGGCGGQGQQAGKPACSATGCAWMGSWRARCAFSAAQPGHPAPRPSPAAARRAAGSRPWPGGRARRRGPPRCPGCCGGGRAGRRRRGAEGAGLVGARAGWSASPTPRRCRPAHTPRPAPPLPHLSRSSS